MENNLVLVLVNNTKEEWLYYELFKIGESHTVTGVLELISRMA